MRTPRMVRILLVSTGLLVAACGTSDGSGASDTPTAPSDGARATGASLEGEITVAAAASLTQAFTDVGKAFEAAHPGTKITFTFDSSGTLAQQILDGAPVDVFASADQANLQKVAAADLVEGKPVVFARNRLAIVTKPGNPEGIASLADLADTGVVSLCSQNAPCGTFAARSLAKAGVTIPESSVTRGQNAKATLAAVSEGDAVAGIVYVTDGLAAGDAIEVVPIPDEVNATATYPVAVLTTTQDATLAAAFVHDLTSAASRAVLAERGFLPPS